MVRQIEVEKPRRTNMVNSSINAAPKKGGAGGNFTWGDTTEAAYYYESCGPELNLAGVIVAPRSKPIEWKGSNGPFDMNLESFPCLPTSMKPKELDQATMMAPETLVPTEPQEDWVVVAAPSEDSLRSPSCTGGFALVDAHHPGKCPSDKHDVNQITSEGKVGEQALSIDWSHEGIPQEVTKKLIKSSLSPSHRGLYANGPVRSLSVDALRAQRASSKHRQDSISKARHNTTSRSQSKPRVMKQPTGRR